MRTGPPRFAGLSQFIFEETTRAFVLFCRAMNQSSNRNNWAFFAAAFILGLAQPLPAQATGSLDGLKTRAERSGYLETSRYDDVMEFLAALDQASQKIHLTAFGYSFEGRSLPLALVGDVRDASPEAVLTTRKTRVYIQANIHAGEVEGKEAALELLRAIAQGRHAAWLNSMILLVAPIYNADGNERVNLSNRPAQHGPFGGTGQRANAQGYDLNRDHIKLDSPEARSFVRLLNRYDPHVTLDLHTTNGTRHAYHLTYAPPLHPNTSAGVVDLLRSRLLPAVTREIKRQDGWDIYYYGNLPGRNSGMERGWYTSDHYARFNNNYVGLRNRLAILSEAYSYLTFRDRILATRRFVEEILNEVHALGDRIRKVTEDADGVSIVGQQLAVRAEFEKSAQPVEILMGEVSSENNPYTGSVVLRRLDVRRPERMFEFGTFRATETERLPQAYIVPGGLSGVIDRLDAHGVRFSKMDRPVQISAEHFRISRSNVAERTYQGHNERTLEGAWEPVSQEIEAGSLLVPVSQPLGRLIFSLLEPRSDDGLATWNLMDEALKDADHYPVLRVRGGLPGGN
jgi:hypothetical protein